MPNRTYKGRDQLRESARSMRMAGSSYGEIRVELELPYRTVANWVSDIELTDEQIRTAKHYSSLRRQSKRTQLIELCDGKCQVCGRKTWRGQPIVLELHHIEGRESDELADMQMLCPNCHSQTPGWRGRGVKKNSWKNKLRVGTAVAF